MRFSTMTARFPGTCKRCKQPINIGDTIRYGGRGLTYHLAADCNNSQTDSAADLIQAGNDARRAMTAELANDLRQTFTGLLARPVSRTYDPADEKDAETPPASGWTAQDDADHYNARRNTGAITPSAVLARKTAATIDADLF